MTNKNKGTHKNTYKNNAKNIDKHNTNNTCDKYKQRRT